MDNNFEKMLSGIPKPQVGQLQHADLLAAAIQKTQDRSVLSWWWLSLPLYLIAAFWMKSAFMPGTGFLQQLHEWAARERFFATFLFLLLPFLFLMLSLLGMRKVYFLSGSPNLLHFLRIIWQNLLIIVVSLFVILIYLI